MRTEHNTGQHVLTVRDLHVHYGKVCALHDVGFEVACGSALALIGANGSGKSTLLKCIVGLVPQSAGTVLWRGSPFRRRSHEIAYLPQREALDWEFPLTVRGLVEMGRYALLGPLRPFGTQDAAAVDRAMEAMRISELAKRHISALSGGQQQRAFVARALAQEAHVLLLDEPFTGLDRPARETLAELLRGLVKEGALVIASHHDLHTAGDIFDQALLLRRRPVAFGPVETTLTTSHLAETFS
jgi:ABC-type Mn2+/Zn2+ transport system ATPase subunit